MVYSMTEDTKLDPVNIKLKDEIKNIIRKRTGIYRSVLIVTALSKNQDSWKNIFTKITLSDKDENISENSNYGTFILNKVCITIEDFLKMLDDLIMQGILKIKNCPDVKAKGGFDQNTYWRYTPSNNEYFKNEWPLNLYVFNVESNLKGSLQSGPLASPQYPYFPDDESAIKYYAGFDTPQRFGDILVFLPNYQIKINKLTIASEHLNLDVTTNGILQEEIIGKLYYEKEELIKTENFSIDKNPKSIHIGFIPDMISLHLLRNNGEILDFRKSYLKWPSSSKDVVIEVKEGDIIEMIKQGENQRVEFKREINKGKEEFAETAVAFANSEGGAILLGIDDNTNIVGTYEEKIEERVMSILRSRCEPLIEPDIKKITIEDKPIVVIRINEGKNKPYILRDRGVYIRSGSSDRSASRMELDEFYEEKRNPPFGQGI